MAGTIFRAVGLSRVYQTGGGAVHALDGIDLEIEAGA